MHAATGMGLSKNHLADYMRVYFMHHFGGCYHDVKPRPANSSWAPAFDAFAANASAWVLGIREFRHTGAGCDESYVTGAPLCEAVRSASDRAAAVAAVGRLPKTIGKCCRMVRRDYKKLVSNGAYCMRRASPLTAEWLANVESHLTAKLARLAAHPSPMPRCCHPNGPYPKGPYPFR